MNFIDSHTHLYVDAFDSDRAEMIERAIQSGVQKFVLPAIDSRYTQAMYDLESAYPDHMFLMTGLHPVSVAEVDPEEELKFIETELARRKFYAIGEIGIDLHWHPETLDLQKEVFQKQIRLAKKYKLPIVIHCRDAFKEVFEVLEAERSEDLFGIFHCFTGTYEDARQAIDLGLKLGIGGIVTFKNGGIDKFLNRIDLKNLVLETDAPYLAPSPYRGKRNESSYLIQIAQKIASLYEIGLDEVAEITSENTRSVFKIAE